MGVTTSINLCHHLPGNHLTKDANAEENRARMEMRDKWTSCLDMTEEVPRSHLLCLIKIWVS
jgi:hypothetical protein